jgi:hypothetical protein
MKLANRAMRKISLTIVAIVLSFANFSTALALSSEKGSDPTGYSQRYVIERDPWYDPTACPGGSGNNGSSNYFNVQSGNPQGQTYILGDSISVGLKRAGLEDKLAAKGYPTKINANGSRSITSPGTSDGGGPKRNAYEAVQDDAAYIKDSKNVIIALGTNTEGNFSDKQKKLIDQIKAINPNANISWVDVFSIGTKSEYKAAVKGINTQIFNNQSTYGYKVIDAYKFIWGANEDAKNIDTKNPPDPNRLLDNGNIHPSSNNGYSKYADWMVQTITSQSPNQGVIANPSCQCPSSVGSSSAGLQELEGHRLPAYKGGAGSEEPINEAGRVPSTNGPVTFSGFAKLGQEYRDYYITMRWKYAKWAWDGRSTKGPEDVGWYSAKPRKVLVTNPRTGKSIIAPILEAGPAPWTGTPGAKGDSQQKSIWESTGAYRDGTPDGYLGRVSGFPPKAQEALEMQQWTYGGPGQPKGSGDELLYSWAPDQEAKPGPVIVEGTNPVTQNSSTSGSIVCNQGLDNPAAGNGNYVFYSQHDPKWASAPYGSSGTISSSGCGPTSTAMAITNLTGKSILPPQIATEFGYMHVGGGSSWALFTVAPQKYGLKTTEIGTDTNRAKDVLKAGAVIIASGRGSNPFTGGGHIITIRGVDNEGNFLLGDPNRAENNTKSFKPDELRNAGLANMWAVTK